LPALLTTITGASPKSPPSVTQSPTFVPHAGMRRAPVVFALIMPMAMTSAITPARAPARKVAGHDDHVEAQRTHRGHGLELLDAEHAVGGSLGHSGVLAHRDEGARKAAGGRRRHGAGAPTWPRPMLLRIAAMESPTAGVGGERRIVY